MVLSAGNSGGLASITTRGNLRYRDRRNGGIFRHELLRCRQTAAARHSRAHPGDREPADRRGRRRSADDARRRRRRRRAGADAVSPVRRQAGPARRGRRTQPRRIRRRQSPARAAPRSRSGSRRRLGRARRVRARPSGRVCDHARRGTKRAAVAGHARRHRDAQATRRRLPRGSPRTRRRCRRASGFSSANSSNASWKRTVVEAPSRRLGGVAGRRRRAARTHASVAGAGVGRLSPRRAHRS